jgi:hypothetical protein
MGSHPETGNRSIVVAALLAASVIVVIVAALYRGFQRRRRAGQWAHRRRPPTKSRPMRTWKGKPTPRQATSPAPAQIRNGAVSGRRRPERFMDSGGCRLGRSGPFVAGHVRPTPMDGPPPRAWSVRTQEKSTR